MKVLSWNVNSIRVRKDQLLSVIKKENPDIICLQETKTINDLFPKETLEKKADEFMELQAHMAPPKDLEMLRMQIQEEFELPHQEALARVHAEVAKYREMFYNVRREHELLRTEFEQFSVDAGKREESLHASHLVVVNQMRAKLAAHAESRSARARAKRDARLALLSAARGLAFAKRVKLSKSDAAA